MENNQDENNEEIEKNKVWFNKEILEVELELETNIKNGLNEEEVNIKREKFGNNELKAEKKESLLVKFLNQFKDFSIIILIIAAIVSGIVGVLEGEGITDTIIILIVVFVNAIIGVTQEAKAEKSLEALQKLTDHASKVIRDNHIKVIPAKELVPGDIIVLDTGDYIPADIRLVEAVNLKVQESSLTGESVPVEKNAEKINGGEIGVGDRVNMLFSSSLVTYGRGKGIVVETGMTTEVGKIAGMINSVKKQETPLQTKLNKLRKNFRYCSSCNLYTYIFNRNYSRKRSYCYVYDSCVTCSSSYSRRISSSINYCTCNRSTKNG